MAFAIDPLHLLVAAGGGAAWASALAACLVLPFHLLPTEPAGEQRSEPQGAERSEAPGKGSDASS
jgi:hypothetical protein